MPQRNRRRFIGDDRLRPRDPRPPDPSRHVLAIAGGVVFYFALVWFGIEVVGDTASRSLIIAGLIVLLAGVGYVLCVQPPV